MSEALYNNDISVMEDLDPEPSTQARSVRARELILGLLLLVGVLGWAGWHLWRDAALRNNYDLGQQAAEGRDWDSAFAYFDSARGYRDATARADQITQRIEERDEHYRHATSHAEGGKWAASLQAARAVATIQPGYKDIDTVIFSAERNVYREALSGTVALRVEVARPGLYYQDGQGWTWLVGSDEWSDLRASGNGAYLYDVPGTGWAPRPTATPARYHNEEIIPGSPELAGRKLMVATPAGGGGFAYQETTLDPALYDVYILNKRGIWAIRYKPYSETIAGNTRQVLLDSWYVWAGPPTFEAFGSASANPGTVISSTFTLEPGLEVADLGYGGTRVLLAEYIGQPGAEGISNLYVVGPDHPDRRLVYSTRYRLKNALLSPDERFVLVTTFERVNEISGKMTAILLDLDGNTGPFVLAENNARVSDIPDTEWTTVDDRLAVGATFLYEGYFANKLLVATTRQSTLATTATLRLIDPLHVEETRSNVLATISANAQEAIPIYQQDDGKTLLMHSVLPTGMSTMTLIRPDERLVDDGNGLPATESYEHYFQVPKETTRGAPYLSDFVLTKEGLLLFEAKFYIEAGPSTGVYAMPVTDLGNLEANVTEVFSNTVPINSTGPTVSWATGPGMFAYTSEGNVLHARTYDGSIDLVLEPGVRFLRDDKAFYLYSGYLR